MIRRRPIIVALLIATAVSDSLNDRRGWLFVTVVATGYIVSRGLAKGGRSSSDRSLAPHRVAREA
jgi:hypothetical protein